MGFRSTLISMDYPGNLPEWFKEKYNEKLVFLNGGLLIASKHEFKIYSNEIFEDYHKAILESGFWKDSHRIAVTVSVLHEDAEITKVVISNEGIKYVRMDESYEDETVWMG